MKIDTKHNLAGCVDKTGTRLEISEPYLCGNRAIATNGRILAAVPVGREEGDVDGYLSIAALKAAAKLARGNAPAEIKANGMLELRDGTKMPRPNEGRTFPNYAQVIPKEKRPDGMKIALNSKLLSALAAAIGNDVVTLHFAPDGKGGICNRSPILVYQGAGWSQNHTTEDGRALGVIMPVSPI